MVLFCSNIYISWLIVDEKKISWLITLTAHLLTKGKKKNKLLKRRLISQIQKPTRIRSTPSRFVLCKWTQTHKREREREFSLFFFVKSLSHVNLKRFTVILVKSRESKKNVWIWSVNHWGKRKRVGQVAFCYYYVEEKQASGLDSFIERKKRLKYRCPLSFWGEGRQKWSRGWISTSSWSRSGVVPLAPPFLFITRPRERSIHSFLPPLYFLPPYSPKLRGLWNLGMFWRRSD